MKDERTINQSTEQFPLAVKYEYNGEISERYAKDFTEIENVKEKEAEPDKVKILEVRTLYPGNYWENEKVEELTLQAQALITQINEQPAFHNIGRIDKSDYNDDGLLWDCHHQLDAVINLLKTAQKQFESQIKFNEAVDR